MAKPGNPPVPALCPICGAKSRVIRHDVASSRFFRCTACAFIRRDPADRLDASAEYAIYEQHQNEIDDPRYNAYFRDFIDRAVLPFAGSGLRGLDFGSGPQPVLATLLAREYGYRMDWYDKFYAPVPVPTGRRYDLVTCTEVLEHIPDPPEFMARLARHLKTDGVLSVMTLLHDGTDKMFRGWFYPRDPSHVSFFHMDSLRVLARRSGLRLLWSDGKRCHTFKAAARECPPAPQAESVPEDR